MNKPFVESGTSPPFTLADRFWSKVKKTEGCWLWTAATNHDGYGRIRVTIDGRVRMSRAHRVSWMLSCGPIPPGRCVLHHCDNPRCVRPDHLFLGTQRENVRDRDRKGRAARGDRHGSRTQPGAFARRADHPREHDGRLPRCAFLCERG